MSDDAASAVATTGAESDPDPNADLPAIRQRWRLDAAFGGRGTETAAAVAGVAAVVAIAGRAALRVLGNLPFEPVVVPPSVHAVAAVATPVVLGLGLFVAGVVSDRPTSLVGLLFAGVFGVAGALIPGMALPAAGAIAAGGSVALLGPLARPDRHGVGGSVARRRVLAVGFVAAVAVSLASSVGVVDGGVRGPGAVIALGAVAATGTLAGRDLVALGIGGIAVAAVLLVGIARPFVVGSALLVGFGVTGAPYALVALAVGGGLSAAVGGARSGERALAIGACLLVLAGVPATFPQTMAVLLGAWLVLLGGEEKAGVDGFAGSGIDVDAEGVTT